MGKIHKIYCVIIAIGLSTISIAPLWRPRLESLKEPIMELLDSSETEEEQQFVQLIDEASERFARWCNKGWRQDIVERHRNPKLQEESSTVFAAVFNTLADQSGSKMRINKNNIEDGIHEDLLAQKQLWQSLTGRRGDTIGLNEEFNSAVSQDEQQESLEDIISSLPEWIEIRRNAGNSNRYNVQDIADLTK